MCGRIALTTRVFLVALAFGMPSLAQDAGQPETEWSATANMPGNTGGDASAIRINRGSGFAPHQQSGSNRGVVADASRPVVVLDEPASRTGRLVSQHQWGVPGRSRSVSSNRSYIVSGPRYRYRSHTWRDRARDYKRHSGPIHGRFRSGGATPKGFGNGGIGKGVFVNTGNFGFAARF